MEGVVWRLLLVVMVVVGERRLGVCFRLFGCVRSVR